MNNAEMLELLEYRRRQPLVEKVMLVGFDWIDAPNASSANALHAAIVALADATACELVSTLQEDGAAELHARR